MLFWILTAIITFGTVLALVWPIIDGADQEPDRAEYGLQVYRDQLAELERDRHASRIGDTELEAARTEIQRRMLAADNELRASTKPPANTTRARQMLVAAMLVFFVPSTSLAIYSTLGNPGLPDQPFATRQVERMQSRHIGSGGGATQADQHPGMGEMVAQLRKRLKQDPNDHNGWVLLGRSYLVMREYAKAADALHQAVDLSQGDPRSLAAYGEALTMVAGGSVTSEAEATFNKALKRMPGEPRARFYLGLVASQNGHYEDALRRWVSLEADTPAGAGWEDILKQHISDTAAQSGLDVEALRLAERAKQPVQPSTNQNRPNSPVKGPSQEQVAAAQHMSLEARQTMIKGMVAKLANRLKESPDDIDGWLRLGRSYGVLNRPKDALEAYVNAAERAPDRIDVQMAYARALFPQGTPEEDMPESFKTVINRVLMLDPNLPEAMFYGGMIATREGDTPRARDLWSRLLERLGPAAPARPILDRRLKALSRD